MWQEATHNVLYLVIISLSLHIMLFPISSPPQYQAVNYTVRTAKRPAGCVSWCVYTGIPPLVIRSTGRRELPLRELDCLCRSKK